MPKRKSSYPAYRKHKQSGQAIVTINGKDHLLGPYGTQASRDKYDRLITEWLACGRQTPKSQGDKLTVAELVDRYWTYAKSYYVKNGKPTDEQACLKSAIRPLVRLYCDEPAENFGPLALRAVRDAMLAKDWMRETINQNVNRIRRVFRWGVEQQLVSESTYNALRSVSGLRKGRCDARESDGVKPVADDLVQATLKHLPTVVADMVRIQRLTGMRPGEVCSMRPIEIDRSEEVWSYWPESHKTDHLDRDRVIFIGPQAQPVLTKYLACGEHEFCFSPQYSETQRRKKQHANRKTPLSQGDRPGTNRKDNPLRSPRKQYDPDSYRQAIERACDRCAMLAAPPEFLPTDGESLNHWYKRLMKTSKVAFTEFCKQFRWSPNQLRHSAATEIRSEFSLEAARAVLGHAKADTTQMYAEQDRKIAKEVAAKLG